MRVLLLTTDSYGGHGGIAYFNRCLAEALSELPEVDEVVVLARLMPFAPVGVPKKVRFIQKSAGSKFRYVYALLGVANEQFDLVICGHINLLPLAALFASLKRAHMVLQVHGIDVWRPIPRVGYWLKRVDSVWSVSGVTRDRMNAWAKLPESNYTIIPNTYHPERYGIAPMRQDLIQKYGLEGCEVVMTLARLAGFERYKGIDEILEVMPALLGEVPNLVYVVLGDGDDQQRLQEKAEALGVADKVVFAGYIGEAEKADHLRLADAFALPGRGEGFGIVYLEAMACGVPVVGSKLDGSREALRDGMLGELVDPNDPESIKQGILAALAKPKGIPEGLDYFAWPAFSQRVAAAVRSLARP